MEYIKALLEPLRGNTELGVSFNPPATIQELKSLHEALKQDIPKDIQDFYSYCNGFETLDYLFRILPIAEILQHKLELGVSSFDFAEYMIYSDVWTLNVINSEEYTITNENHKTEEIVTLSNSIFEFIDRYAHGGVFGTNGLYEWSEQIRLERSQAAHNNAFKQLGLDVVTMREGSLLSICRAGHQSQATKQAMNNK